MKYAFAGTMATLPARSLTWDRGKEMSAHAQFHPGWVHRTGQAVSLRTPRSSFLGLLLAVVLGLGGLILGAAPAYACSCVYQFNDPGLVEQADAVFTGTVVEDRTVGELRYLTFAVDRVHKGDVAARQRLTTAAQSSACGLALNNGTGPYLVQGYGAAANLRADQCGGTRSMDLVTGLGAGVPPRPGQDGPLGPDADAGGTTLLAGAAVVIFGATAAVLLLRRRRSTRLKG